MLSLVLPRRARLKLRAFGRDRRGVSAIEFAMLAPVLAAMLAGAVELGGGITASNRATYVADAIGELVSQVSSTITADDMNGFIRTAALIDPDIVRYAAQTGKSLETAAKVTVSSVQFELKDPSCTSGCEYNAFVVFSAALSGSPRSCGTLTPALIPALTTLPADVYSSGSIVVVEVEITYRPLMNKIFGKDITFKRSTYFRPRYVSRVNYAKNCPYYKVS